MADVIELFDEPDKKRMFVSRDILGFLDRQPALICVDDALHVQPIVDQQLGSRADPVAVLGAESGGKLGAELGRPVGGKAGRGWSGGGPGLAGGLLGDGIPRTGCTVIDGDEGFRVAVAP